MTSPRSLPLVALALAVAVLVICARVIAGGQTWDDVRYHTEVAPPRLAAADQIQRGSFPAWWDGTGLGVPLAAEPSHGAMYPPLWLAATPRALDLVMIVHLAWAALGVAVWGRRRARANAAATRTASASDLAALVAGVLVASTGILASAALRGALPALAHLPWLGACALWLGEAEGRRDQTRAVVAIAVLLGLVGLTGELAVLVDAVVLVVALAARRRTLGALAVALGGGLAISCAQWVPAALLLAGDHAHTLVAPLPLARLVELVVPGSFGAGDPARAVTALAGTSPWAPSLFVGVPLVAFAAVRVPSRRVLGLIVGLGSAALIAGRGTWPAWLGAPELHLGALALVLGAQAGAGVDALVAGKARAVRCLAAGAACAAVALIALAVLRRSHPEATTAIDRALLDGILGVLCLAIVVVLGWRSPGRAMPIVLALLVLPGVGARPSVAPMTPRVLVDEPPSWVKATEGARAPARLFRPAFMFEEAEGVEEAVSTFAGASGWRWGIVEARSSDPARARVHDELWLAASREGGALLDRFGIALAILPETLVRSSKMTTLGQRGRWSLVTLPVAPLASVLRGWRWAVAPEDGMELLFASGGGTNVLRGTAVLAGRGDSQEDRGPLIPCTIEAWAEGEQELACTLPAADVSSGRPIGYAAVSSSAAPGWTVSVDGADRPWLTADVLRRAVELAPGTHRVHWRFTAPGTRLGLGIALVGLLGLVALWLGARLRGAPGRQGDGPDVS